MIEKRLDLFKILHTRPAATTKLEHDQISNAIDNDEGSIKSR